MVSWPTSLISATLKTIYKSFALLRTKIFISGVCITTYLNFTTAVFDGVYLDKFHLNVTTSCTTKVDILGSIAEFLVEIGYHCIYNCTALFGGPSKCGTYRLHRCVSTTSITFGFSILVYMYIRSSLYL